MSTSAVPASPSPSATATSTPQSTMKRSVGRPRGTGPRQLAAARGEFYSPNINKKGPGRPRKTAADESSVDLQVDGEEEDKKRQRREKRQPVPIPFVGLGYNKMSGKRLWMLEGIEIFRSYPRPWWMRRDISPNGVEESILGGPFEDHDFLDWFLSREKQRDFAERFAIPMLNGGVFRKLDSDTTSFDGVQDATQRVLFAATALHPKTALDKAMAQEIESVIIPQFHKDMLSTKAMSGALGGLCGTDTTIFWWLSVNEDMHVSPRPFLSLVSTLTHALLGTNKQGEEYWPGVQTQYTLLNLNTRSVKIKGASYFTNGDCNKMSKYDLRSTAWDIDETLLASVVKRRCLESGDDAVSDHMQVNCASCSGRPIPESCEKMTECRESNLFEAYIHIDVFQGLDEFGKFAFIKLHSFRIKPKIPGIDPCLAIQQWWQNCKDITNEQQDAFSEVLRHMSFMTNEKFVNTGDIFSNSSGIENQLTSLTCEANITFAAARLANRNKYTDISFGGVRFDWNNSGDRKSYLTYLHHLWNARKNHFSTVAGHVEDDLGIRGFTDCAHYPVKKFPLDSGCMIHYRSITLREFKGKWLPHLYRAYHKFIDQDDFKKIMTDVLIGGDIESCPQNLVINDEDFENWLTSTHDTDSEDLSIPLDQKVFFPVGGAPCISGIYLKINLSEMNKNMNNWFLKNKARGSTLDDRQHIFMVQPSKASHVMKIYLDNQCDQDPFARFIEENICIDSDAIQKENKMLCASGIQLASHLSHLLTGEMLGKSMGDLYEEELFRLYGKMDSPALIYIDSIKKSANLTTMACGLHSILDSAIIEAKDTMLGGDLLQFEKAARGVQELKLHSKVHSGRYITSKMRFNEYAKNYKSGSVGYMDDNNFIAIFHNYTRIKLDLDIYWGNELLMGEILNAMVGLFCFQKRAWGFTLWICNMGQTVSILAESTNKSGYHRSGVSRTAVNYNMKDPSMGADAISQLVGELNQKHGEHSLFDTDPALHRWYNMESNKDEIKAWNSAFSMTSQWGCGIQRRGGKIRFEDASYREEMGIGGVFTELQKKCSGSERSIEAMADIEGCIANSGQGKGMKTNNWTTSSNLQTVSVVSLQPLPLFLVCSNRNMIAPRSIPQGGRMKIYATTIEDGNVGVLIASKKEIKNFSDDKRKHNSVGSLLWNDEGAQEIRDLGKSHLEENPIFFIARHWMRKLVPFTHRVLATAMHEQFFSLSFNFRNLLTSTIRLTSKIRRQYMDHRKTFGRTFNGPFKTATAFPIYIQNTILRCIMQAIEANAIVKTPSGKQNLVSFTSAFFNCMRTLHECPIDTHSILSSLYTWMSQTVLDPNSMIITCYASYLLGLEEACSIFILAKAVKCPHLLSEEEKLMYIKFCEFLREMIKTPTPRLQHGATDLFFENNRRQESRLACSRQFEGVRRKTLTDWYREEQADFQKKMRDVDRHRHSGMKSTYLRPKIVMHDPIPHWLIQTQHFNRGSNDNDADASNAQASNSATDNATEDENINVYRDEFVCGTVHTQVLHSFAQQQDEKAEKRRKILVEMDEYEQIPKFWDAVHQGTKLPKPDCLTGSDKAFEKQFQPVYMTSLWWDTTVKNLGSADGPIRQFLTLLGMKATCSRLDVITTIFKHYLDLHQMQEDDLCLPDNEKWNQPIIDCSRGEPIISNDAFSFGFHPYRNPRNFEYFGMECFLGIDILWFIVGQSFFCSDWKCTYEKKRKADDQQNQNIQRRKTVVHLRNMGHATKCCIELMMHTMFGKAEIPQSPIHLIYPDSNLVSTNNSKKAVCLNFYPELHIDSEFNLQNVLSISKRMSRDFVLESATPLSESGDYAIHTSVRQGLQSSGIDFQYGQFPFTFEDVAHVKNLFPKFSLTFGRLAKDFPDNHPTLILAMRMFGDSIESEMVQHFGLHLTDTVAGIGNEIPCMLYNSGHIFTLRFEKRFIRVIPTVSTHLWHNFDEKLSGFHGSATNCCKILLFR